MTGERLGPIGNESTSNAETGVDTSHEANSKQIYFDSLPPWKKALVTGPSVSVRTGYCQGYDPPYEDTDTLVLTSTNSKFVDIRFPKQYDKHLDLHHNEAYWAFTGVSKVTFPGFKDQRGEVGTKDEWPYMAHQLWEHDVDSKGSGTVDEADMFVLQNGDTMEVGIAKDEKTGNEKMYKEYWIEPKDEAHGRLKKTPCVVAELVRSTGSLKKGRIMRIGKYCQGVVECSPAAGASVMAVRWEKGPEGDGEGERMNWFMDQRSGLTIVCDGLDTFFAELIPCMWACASKRKLGDELTMIPATWEIVECER